MLKVQVPIFIQKINMKNLSNDELLDLAWSNISKADNHINASIVLVLLSLIQSLLLIFGVVNIVGFLLVYVPSFCLYLYHKHKGDKYLKTTYEVIAEITSRENGL
jgi:hypothetical protein